MTIYVILFTLLAFFSMIECAVNIKRKNVVVLVVIFIVLFWLMSWLRWERGTDWGNYKLYFDDYAPKYETSFQIGFETGFIHLNYFVRQFTENYSVLLFIMGTIAQGFFAAAVLKISKRPITSLFVCFCLYLGFIFLTRQVFANTIVLLSLYYVTKRRFWPFASLLFLASLFHTSALIFLPAYWLYKWKFSTPKLFLLLVCSVAVGLVSNELMMRLFGGMQGMVGAKISAYIEGGYDSTDSYQSPIRVLMGGIVNRGGLLVMALLFMGRNRLKESASNGMVNLYAFGFVLFMITAPIAIGLTRLAGYYDIVIIFLLPLVFDHLKMRSNRVIICGILTLYFAYRLFVGQMMGPYGIYFAPYNTIFTKELPMDVG